MSDRILVLYGSYRSDRAGIRLAEYVTRRLAARGADAQLVDAQRVGLPMLDRMYKEYPSGEAPAAMETLAQQIRASDGFVFVTGEYNCGMQPGLKNLTDHFLESGSGARPASSATRQGASAAPARTCSGTARSRRWA
jgi:NAD(P)H-dependent FMN reductase